ncbi:unnamed protein product [Rangifer tarandus platyrhynchus]|uniref:Uncharacterized protein n=1 Tax=Rangifer tarandus platyrhynchus TaxID=3082113 RepID=A0AC59Y6G8_RANTA
MVAGAFSLPHPPPLGMLSGGSFYYGYLFNFFFFLGKPSCLVTEGSGLKKKKKAAAADAAGPVCVCVCVYVCVCVLVHLSWVAGAALGKFRLFFFFCNLLFRRVCLHPSPRGRPSRTRPHRPRPRGAPGTPSGPGPAREGPRPPLPRPRPRRGEGRAEWDSFRLVQPRRARSSQHFSSSSLWSLYSAERCC